MKKKIDENVVYVGNEETPKEENCKEIAIMIMKGEDNMKVTLKDCIKLGLGIYIGYNVGRLVKHALIKKIVK